MIPQTLPLQTAHFMDALPEYTTQSYNTYTSTSSVASVNIAIVDKNVESQMPYSNTNASLGFPMPYPALLNTNSHMAFIAS